MVVLSRVPRLFSGSDNKWNIGGCAAPHTYRWAFEASINSQSLAIAYAAWAIGNIADLDDDGKYPSQVMVQNLPAKNACHRKVEFYPKRSI
jgi:hypothetical protein